MQNYPPTFSRGLDRFLKDYPHPNTLDRRLLIEVFQNGRYTLFGADTGINFSGRGIALCITTESDMAQQLHDALAYLAASPSQPQSYVQEKSGKAYQIYLSQNERIFL